MFLSTASLITTLLLFDKFGVRKIIFDRKVKAVFDVLEEIHNTNLLVSGYTFNAFNTVSFNMKKDIKIYAAEYEFYRLFPLYMNPVDIKIFAHKFSKLKNNPFLPNEIRNSITYSDWSSGWSSKGTPVDYVEIQINSNLPKTDLIKLTHPASNIDEFTLMLHNTLDEIEKWLKKYADADIQF